MISPPPLGPTDRAALIGIAQAAVRAQLGVAKAPALPEAGPLSQPRGAFVTIYVRGELRGCIGTFRPVGSLAQTVARMAASAASEDPRFQPVSASDLDELDVHVTVLGERRRMLDEGELTVGRDGVFIQLGWHRGTLLPRVAVDEGWDRITFLERTCLKAGLPPDAWKDPEAVVELFSAEDVGRSVEGCG